MASTTNSPQAEQPASTFGNESALVQEIRHDAETKAERTRRRAERDARAILQTAQKDAEADAERILAAARARAERQTARLRRSTEQELRRQVLIAQENVLNDLYAEALGELAKKDPCDYQRALVHLASAAILAMRGTAFTLHLSTRDEALADSSLVAAVRAAVQQAAPDRQGTLELTVAADQSQISGGVIVRSADGHQVFDNSFETRLLRLGPSLRRPLADLLFASRKPDRNAADRPE